MSDPRDMDAWKRADALFDHWLDLDGSARQAWLDALDIEPGVRRRLGRLIDAHDRPSAVLGAPGPELAGLRLGAWTLESELGRGGMAVVYRASRSDGMARQEAALKVLTLGALGATGRERFQREVEILARLNHPNITPLVDSGTGPDGTCWLAMPLVDGQRIDAWCDRKGFDARAVVRLFLQVCDAVAFAHRNLVIHRDLKPSNVLVEADGHVRLLDFGIGQFADAEGERTQTMWRALTPGYAAPEQMRGEPPTTAIDIYGLGALLHRLLTGRPPQTSDDHAVTTRPSLLVRDGSDAYHRHYVPLKNDLDRVLLKALAEDPDHRYRSAEALADDLRRWLDGRPVIAQAPSLGYRARKFIARHRVGAAAALLVATSLAAGLAATLWQAGEARRAAADALVQAQRASLVREFLERVFLSTEPSAGGVPDALELLDEGAARARSTLLDSDPLAAADILMLTGRTRMDLGRPDDAAADLAQARAILAAEGPDAWRERARIESDLARLAQEQGRIDASMEHANAAVAFADRAFKAGGSPQALLEARLRVGEALWYSDAAAAAAMFEEVLDALHGHGLQDTPLHLEVLNSLSVAVSTMTPFDAERNIRITEELIALSRRVDGPDSAKHAFFLANSVPTFVSAGDYDRAEEIAGQAVELSHRIHERPHKGKAIAHCAMAAFLDYRGRVPEAHAHYVIASGIHEAIGISDLHVASCARNGGYVHAAMGEFELALASLDRSQGILQRVGSGSPEEAVGICALRMSVLVRLDRAADANRLLSECPADGVPPTALSWNQALAELHYARGESDRAAPILARLREAYPPRHDQHHWMRPWMMSLLLASEAGDEGARLRLGRALAGYEGLAPLSGCLANATRSTCLAFPRPGFDLPAHDGASAG